MGLLLFMYTLTDRVPRELLMRLMRLNLQFTINAFDLLVTKNAMRKPATTRSSEPHQPSPAALVRAEMHPKEKKTMNWCRCFRVR